MPKCPHRCTRSTGTNGRSTESDSLKKRNALRKKDNQRSGIRIYQYTKGVTVRHRTASPLQRLTRIKQVGLSSVVYPGAQHTRFQHSLGAFYLMSEAITQLTSKGNFIFDSEAEAVQAAILLHDIGHGPFSHVLEDTIVQGVSHEEISLMLMERMNKEMNGQLSLAIQIFKDEYPKRFLHQLVSGQPDMDRLDYLRRDSFYTGVTEGNIGSARIIKMLDVADDRLVIESKRHLLHRKFPDGTPPDVLAGIPAQNISNL